MYKFCKNNNATVTTKNICNLFSRGAVNFRITQLWFSI